MLDSGMTESMVHAVPGQLDSPAFVRKRERGISCLLDLANASRRRAKAITRAPQPALPQCHERDRELVGLAGDSLGDEASCRAGNSR